MAKFLTFTHTSRQLLAAENSAHGSKLISWPQTRQQQGHTASTETSRQHMFLERVN